MGPIGRDFRKHRTSIGEGQLFPSGRIMFSTLNRSNGICLTIPHLIFRFPRVLKGVQDACHDKGRFSCTRQERKHRI